MLSDDIEIIILAAGSSSRLGQSKQLLEVNGQPLLLKSVKAAIACNVKKIVVVLGANEAAHRQAILTLPIEIIFNPTWQKGMGNSLKVGLAHLLNVDSTIKAVLVMVCDQPLVTAAHLKKLMEKFKETKSPIIASFYSGSAGVPALFEKSLFQKILSIDDGLGAKKIIQLHPDLISKVDFSEGSIDIDTEEDLKNLSRRNRKIRSR
jgi:molybdenum cofactor cytidylyltransferase